MREAAPLMSPLGNVTVTIEGKTVTIPIKITDPAWVSFFQNSLDLYRRTQRYIDPKFTKYGQYEPETPYVGLVAYADGVNWNPGDGEGNYIYEEGEWRYIIPSESIMTLLDFIPNHQQNIRDLEQRVESALAEISFNTNNQQDIRELSQRIESIASQLQFMTNREQAIIEAERVATNAQTLYWMES